MVSIEYSEAISEILDILENSDDTIRKRIPTKLIEFWENNKSTTYIPKLDHTKSLKEMNLKEKTKDIITMIYLNYLTDENEKEITRKIIKKNEENYQLLLREKYNPDNIFKNRNRENEIENQDKIEHKSIIEYKESILKRIINSIKRFFGF